MAKEFRADALIRGFVFYFRVVVSLGKASWTIHHWFIHWKKKNSPEKHSLLVIILKVPNHSHNCSGGIVCWFWFKCVWIVLMNLEYSDFGVGVFCFVLWSPCESDCFNYRYDCFEIVWRLCNWVWIYLVFVISLCSVVFELY